MTPDARPKRHAVHLLSNAFTHDPRVENEVRSLTAAGYRVTVLAWDRRRAAPGTDERAGARVQRIHNEGLMRVLPLDILRLRPFWGRLADDLRRIHAADPVHLIHAHDLDTLPGAARAKAATGARLVYDAHEIWGDMIQRDLPAWVGARFHRLEQRLVPSVDACVTVNEPVRDHLQAQGARRVEIVMNAKDPGDPDYTAPPSGPFRVLYIGTLNDARLLVESIEAMDGLESVELIIGGIGKPGYVKRLQAAAARAANVRFLGPVATHEVVPRTRDAHAVLCMIDPADKNNRIASANKQFEALAAGRPIITTEGTYPGRFTTVHAVGLAVPHTKAGVRDAVTRLRDNAALATRLGRTAKALATKTYHWNAQATRLVQLYDDLLGVAP